MFRDHYGDLSITVMGMSLAIAEVKCAAQFAVANISIASAALLLQNVQTVNCRGGHSANDKICPRYKRETEILKLKTEAKLSYADACKAHRFARSPPVPYMSSQSAFPPLPKKTVGVDRTQRVGLRGGGQRGNCPGPPAGRGPRDEIYLFQIKYSFEKFRDSEAIQEYNSILYSYVALSIKGPQQQLISLQV